MQPGSELLHLNLYDWITLKKWYEVIAVFDLMMLVKKQAQDYHPASK